MRGKVSRHNLFAGRGGDDLESVFDVSSNIENARRSVSTYIYRNVCLTPFRSSRSIFYSAKHIFAAEHVSTVQKRRSYMHILKSLCLGKACKKNPCGITIAKKILGQSSFLRNYFRNISDEDAKNYWLNIYFSVKMQILLLL